MGPRAPRRRPGSPARRPRVRAQLALLSGPFSGASWKFPAGARGCKPSAQEMKGLRARERAGAARNRSGTLGTRRPRVPRVPRAPAGRDSERRSGRWGEGESGSPDLCRDKFGIPPALLARRVSVMPSLASPGSGVFSGCRSPRPPYSTQCVRGPSCA